MNDKDKEAFEKWWKSIFGNQVYFGFSLCEESWKSACEYMRNKPDPLDALSLYEKLEREREKNKKLREALEEISGYIPHNGDSWASEKAREALKEI